MNSSTIVARQDQVRKEILKRNLDSIIVTSWENLYYLTGARPLQFSTKSYDPMPLVISADDGRDAVFFPNVMFGMAAKLEHQYLKDVRPYDGPEPWSFVSELLSQWNVKRIGIEAKYLSSSHADAFRKRVGGVAIVDVTDLVENIRMVKTPEELDYLRRASEISDRVAKSMVDYLVPGKTEMDAARDIVGLIAEYGGEDFSFHPQVFSGRRGYLLNISSSGRKRLERGELVILDYGAVCEGYKTDITRTYVLGEPSSKHVDIDKKVVKITQDVMNFVRAGKKASDVHLFALRVFKEVGYDGWCRHYSGHGLGIGIERPLLREYDQTEIKENMVLAVEQGLYFPDFGIRYEDNIIVSGDGFEDMNKIPMGLVQVG